MAKRRRKSSASKQGSVVMKEFHKGKLRSSSSKKVTKVSQAKAIAASETRAAKKRGVKRRTWHGRTRMRPRLKRHK